EIEQSNRQAGRPSLGGSVGSTSANTTQPGIFRRTAQSGVIPCLPQEPSRRIRSAELPIPRLTSQHAVQHGEVLLGVPHGHWNRMEQDSRPLSSWQYTANAPQPLLGRQMIVIRPVD